MLNLSGGVQHRRQVQQRQMVGHSRQIQWQDFGHRAVRVTDVDAASGRQPDEQRRTGACRDLGQGARHAAARSVNALMTFIYWEISRRIVEADELGERRAAGHFA